MNPSLTQGLPRDVFFVSDSTGITAETLGNALLANFPSTTFRRRTVAFVDTDERADAVVASIGRASAEGLAPLVFTTVKKGPVWGRISAAPAMVIDLLGGHLADLETELGVAASPQLGQFHGVGDAHRYFARMHAVEYAIEHDDGQSARGLDRADVIIVAPSRCGKTPATMYLALQYGLLVANYPLTDDDFPTGDLPATIAAHADRCFGLTTTPRRLSEVRHERRPHSRYASLAQCAMEIRRAESLYRDHHMPFLNSATRSVEEMSAVILQSMGLRD